MKLSPRGIVAVVCYLLVYALSLWHLSSSPGFEAGDSLSVFLIFGVGFSVIAWLSTIGMSPAPMEVRAPAREFTAVTLYMIVFSIAVLGYAFSALKAGFPNQPQQDIAV